MSPAPLPERLLEIEVEVFEAVDRMCLRVGELLYEAQQLDRAGFQSWVEDRMPFGFDKARRLVAIYLAYRELPAETIARLPRPWQAMFVLRRWSTGRLVDAIDSGEIGPDTTVKDALRIAKKWGSDTRPSDEVGSARYSQIDLDAGRLMAADPNELDADVFRALSRWMSRRTQDQT